MIAAPDPRGTHDGGFTLVELLVSLLLFALISMAGVSLVETVVGIQQRTATRADRLAEIQRGLYFVTADFEQLTSGPTFSGQDVAFTRSSRAGDYMVTYRFADGALHRIVSGSDRILIGEVANARWRFFRGGQWNAIPTTREDESRPTGVELSLGLAKLANAPGGTLRRIVELPAEK